MKQFQINGIYKMRSPGDHNCIWSYIVKARTDSTVTLWDGKKETRCRINKKLSEMDGAEVLFPLGRYSMAPVLRAY